MKLAYESDWCTLYQGDAAEALDVIADKSIDLIVTDPPYGVAWSSGLTRDKRWEILAGDSGELDVEAIMGLFAYKLRESRHAYIFGSTAWDLDRILYTEPTELIWDKEYVGSGDLTKVWSKTHEKITFVTRCSSKVNRHKGYGRLSARLRKGAVLRHPRLTGAGAKRHPTEKPVSLLRELIESSSCLGEIVLDPFVGSGSTMVAAVIEGRRSIGIEIDPQFCRIAVKRIRRIEAAMEGINRRV